MMNSLNRPRSIASSGQCRAARAFLDWSQAELARRSRVARAVIVKFESGKRIHRRTAMAITDALEQNGVRFLPPQEGQGVLLQTRDGAPASRTALEAAETR